MRAHLTTDRFLWRARAVVTVLLAAVVLAGCGGAAAGEGGEEIDTGDWAETVMIEQMSGFNDTMGEVADTVQPGERAASREACEVVGEWALDARSAPRPKDDRLAAAYEQFIDVGEAYGEGARFSADQDVILEFSGEITDAMDAMKDAIVAAQ